MKHMITRVVFTIIIIIVVFFVWWSPNTEKKDEEIRIRKYILFECDLCLKLQRTPPSAQVRLPDNWIVKKTKSGFIGICPECQLAIKIAKEDK